MNEAEHYIETHGEQVLTALRSQIEYWRDRRQEYEFDKAMADLCDHQIEDWQRILAKTQALVDHEHP